MVGWGKSRLKTISAQLKLKLGLSLAISTVRIIILLSITWAFTTSVPNGIHTERAVGLLESFQPNQFRNKTGSGRTLDGNESETKGVNIKVVPKLWILQLKL